MQLIWETTNKEHRERERLHMNFLLVHITNDLTSYLNYSTLVWKPLSSSVYINTHNKQVNTM